MTNHAPNEPTEPNMPGYGPTRPHDPHSIPTQIPPEGRPQFVQQAPQQYPGNPPARPSRVSAARNWRRQNGKQRKGCLNPNCLLGCFGVVGVFAITSVIGLFFVYSAYSSRVEDRIGDLERELNNLDDPTNPTNFETTYIYDRDGNQIYEVFGQGRRKRVGLDEIPDYMIWATVSVEDDTFYDNIGVDIPSIMRSMRDYLREGQVVSGASTISQQLVRNVVFDPEYRQEQTISRKMDEAMLAIVLNRKLSKDEIMELYLNQIYYGNLAYGVEAASQVYFGKSAKELNLNEAALLAALPQSPSLLDPLNPDPLVQQRVMERQQLVLDLMVQEGYITQQEADNAKQQTLVFASPDIPLDTAPHFVIYAQDELETLLTDLGYSPDLINNGGLRVYTTLNQQFQQIAQDSVTRRVAEVRDAHDLTNSAVVVIHPPSGEIMAMVGSVDYNDDSIDGRVNVAISLRQPGSTMKAFTYAAAMEQGWTAGTIIWDSPVQFGIPGQAAYVPANYDGRFHGPQRVRDTLANSYNIPAVMTLEKVGVEYLLQFMHRFGVESLSQDASQYGLSLTLGGGDITLMELTNGYATFARGGKYVKPTTIRCVLDKKGNILYEYEEGCPSGTETGNSIHNGPNPQPVLDERIAFIISDILSDNNARSPAFGSNSPLNTGNLLTSVKTGTTNDYKDNWTVGYTHDLAIGVWSGNSDSRPMRNISGIQGAAPIWNDTMLGIYAAYSFPPSTLPVPGGVSQQRICDVRQMRDPAFDCPAYRTEWYIDGAPYLPDGNGGMVPYPQNVTTPVPRSEFGPQLVEIEPGIVRVWVRPLSPDQQNVLMAQHPDSPVAPKYCMVPIEIVGQVPDAVEQAFIMPPSNTSAARGAQTYAASSGHPILPMYACIPETLVASAPVNSGGPWTATGYITSPAPGEVLSGNIPIYGVAFTPPGINFVYYKIDVIGGPLTAWTTLGSTHPEQYTTPSYLETFMAEALPPGEYQLRLVVYGDQEYISPSVPFILTTPGG
ncbi:MAG: transglycosylase domain-containing protein [Anaerolineae bacterium]|nr:transglycosylase domain-containing protein [Anaerolineae bacterium]